MDRTTEVTKDDQNGSANAGEDSTAMTIEYLRARLHSERSVSKAARERANELAKQVAELEEQLTVISLQRKKAEKATLDLLALLENHGIGDISEECDSDSELDESLYEANVGQSNSATEEERSVSSKRKDGSSGSEHESTPSTGRSLSWKSGKGSSRSSERKYFDSSISKRDNFVRSASSSRHRPGKSCRKVKRREIGSTIQEASREFTSPNVPRGAEESRHEPTIPDVPGSNIVDCSIHTVNGLDSGPKEFSKCSENNVERALFDEQFSVSSKVKGQVSDASAPIQKHTGAGEMERALQHQERLIGRYEAEEKAQIEWEENYMANSCNMPESCEPGNQSDVTEERDTPGERDATNNIGPSPSQNLESREEPNHSGKQASITHIDSFKFSPNTDDTSHKSKLNDMQSHRSSDFVFPVINNTPTPTDNNLSTASAQLPPLHPQLHSPNIHTLPSSSIKEHSIIPHEGPQKLDGVLDALRQAKQLLAQNISSLPSKNTTPTPTPPETSPSATPNLERMKMAVGSASLFRVPADFPPQTTFPDSGSPLHLNSYRYLSSVPPSVDDQHHLHSMDPRPPTSNLDQFFSSVPSSPDSRVSASKPWYDTNHPSPSAFTSYPPRSAYPDVGQRLSNGGTFTVQSPSPDSRVSWLDSGYPYL